MKCQKYELSTSIDKECPYVNTKWRRYTAASAFSSVVHASVRWFILFFVCFCVVAGGTEGIELIYYLYCTK